MSLGIVFHARPPLAYALLGALWLRLAGAGAGASGIEQTGKIARACLLGALVLQGIGLQQAMLGAQHLFIGWALALSAAIWLGMVVFWLESLLVRIDGLQLLLLPAATIASALAALFPQGQFVPHANDAWLRAHLLIALAAYGLITIAALHAMLMALLDRHLHRPLDAPAERSMIGRVLDSQPPLLVQEHLLFVIIWIGFAVLSLAVVRLDRLAQAHRQDPALRPQDRLHAAVLGDLRRAAAGPPRLGLARPGGAALDADRLRFPDPGLHRQPVRAGNDSASGLNVGKLLFWIVIIIAVLCVARIAARMAGATRARFPAAQAARPARRRRRGALRALRHPSARSEALLQNGRTWCSADHAQRGPTGK